MGLNKEILKQMMTELERSLLGDLVTNGVKTTEEKAEMTKSAKEKYSLSKD